MVMLWLAADVAGHSYTGVVDDKRTYSEVRLRAGMQPVAV
jgi:hypothetical protein